MSTKNTLTTRCLICSKEFGDEELIGKNNCPNCGSGCIPCSIKDDVKIKINLHELKVLAVWAENYAFACDNQESNLNNRYYELMMPTVEAILNRIHAQLGKKDVPLTITEEVRDLNKKGIFAKILPPKNKDKE
jgi:DNA-directed RNA polymerase subunit RPC12/RpoP